MLRQPGGGLGARAKALADAHGFIVRIWCDSVGAAPRTRSTPRMNPGACACSSVNKTARRSPGQKNVIRCALLPRLKRSSKRPSPSDRDRGIRMAAPISARKSIREPAAANRVGGSDCSQCSTSGSHSIDHGDTTNDVIRSAGSQPSLSVRCEGAPERSTPGPPNIGAGLSHAGTGWKLTGRMHLPPPP